MKVLICCGCLGDRSDDANEIVECDGCGVTVHEGKKICNHILHVLSQVLSVYLKKCMYLDVLIFFKVATEYLTQQVCQAQYHHVQQNRGFVKHVVLGSQILHVNYVQIQVTLLLQLF